MSRALMHGSSVLVVCAHPDDESFGLGGVLSTLADSGTRLGVRCFTHGEASTLHGVAGDLAVIRAAEFDAAGAILGVTHLELLDYSDGPYVIKVSTSSPTMSAASPTTSRPTHSSCSTTAASPDIPTTNTPPTLPASQQRHSGSR